MTEKDRRRVQRREEEEQELERHNIQREMLKSKKELLSSLVGANGETR